MQWLILLSVGVLLHLPFISTYFRALNTLIHEVGHAVVSRATGGTVRKIEVFSDISGLAWTGSTRRFGRFLTVLAGYPFASLFAAGSAYALSRFGELPVAMVMVGVVAGALVWWVRNPFGVFWSLGFLATTGLILYFLPAYLSIYASLVVQMLLVDSLRSAVIVCRLSIKDKVNAGDASDLADITHTPVMLWGVLFLVQAVICTLLGYQYIFS